MFRLFVLSTADFESKNENNNIETAVNLTVGQVLPAAVCIAKKIVIVFM